MPTILKREFAPVSDQAWQELDKQAAQVLQKKLVGRKLVDFSGPHGWELAAVNLGRVTVAAQKALGDIPWGIREAIPLIEIRIPFKLKQFELDNLTRGASDIDLDPMLEVVGKAACFEDHAILYGFQAGNVKGMLDASAHPPIAMPDEPQDYPQAVGQAIRAIVSTGIDGPFNLVLGTDEYYGLLQAGRGGYPPQKVIKEMLGGQILTTPVLKGGLIAAARGGDFELTVGKDFSLGYADHDHDTVEIFITESFMFRVIEPKAVIALKA